MKKFIICLLLICTICIGCFALTACDEQDTDNREVSRIEFVKNESFYNGSYNLYTFRLWFPYEWFTNGYDYCDIRYASSPNAEFQNISYNAQYLTDFFMNNKYSIVPNSWIYFDIQFESEPNTIYFEATYGPQLECKIIFKSKINLQGTYKTA